MGLKRQLKENLRSGVIAELLEERRFLSISPIASPITNVVTTTPRIMENLGRGVTATRASNTQILITWRLLALDPSTIGFNIYRSANGAAAVKLNGSVITTSTNYSDTTANFTVNNTYFVKPVINGVEQAASGSFTLTANHAVEPVVRVPLHTPQAGYTTKFVWVGDLNGDGEYDYVIDRIPTSVNELATEPEYIEAYTNNGTFLWSVNMGPNSYWLDNIEPGSSALDTGNWDGVTVYDMDGDGKAEVLLKISNGVKFGDGTTLVNANNNVQFISVLNGQTGAQRANIQWSTPYLSDGPMGMMFGIGYMDGVNPHLVVKGKNRVGNGGFNMVVAAFRFNGTAITRQWQWQRGNSDAPDGHNIRLVDVDGDGKDEFCDIGFCLNSNGTLRYSLATTGGIVHGDRFYVGDIDPSHPGLEGYGIQQDNPTLLYDYYYDASSGQMLWQHFSTALTDVGRGLTADVDPRYPGGEVWAFGGIYNAGTNTQTSTSGPWPSFTLQWDGDTLSELYNDGKIEEWNWTSNGLGRLVTCWKFDGNSTSVYPGMTGDIMGDWREEVIMMSLAGDALTIFTTSTATSTRLYTLAQNPLYRNGMTTKGYMQSPETDYFLGNGMSTPPTPNIVYAGIIGSISGQVFEDRNGNGTLDTGEPLQSGITVYIDANNNSSLDGSEVSQITTATGSYAFNGLAAGNYVIRQVVPSGFIGTNSNGTLALAANASLTGINIGNFPTIITGSAAADSYRIRANGLINEIYVGATLTYSIAKTLLPSLTFNTLAGNDTLILDYITGDPIPTGGISFNGGNDSDTVDIRGSGFTDVFAFNSSNIVTHASRSSSFAGAENIKLSSGVYNIGADLGAINLEVSGNTAKVNLTQSQNLTSLKVLNGATVNSNNQNSSAPAIIAGDVTINSATLSIAANGGLSGMSKFSSIAITGTGKLDLHNNDLVIDYGNGATPYSSIFNLVKSGLTLLGGNGNGIASTEVDAQSQQGSILAVVDNGAIGGQFTSLGDLAVSANSILIKYTWLGDANLDGQVGGDDYALADTGITSGGLLNGWLFGDFGYDGFADISDYALLDTGFISQNGVIL